MAAVRDTRNPPALHTQRLLTFDGRSLLRKTVSSSGRLRWACWNEADEAWSIAGDGGTLLSYRAGRASKVQSGTTENLRCVDYDGEVGYACGNRGLVVRLSGGGAERLEAGARENLRRVARRPYGGGWLFVGNYGSAYLLGGSRFSTVHGADTNLRSVAWHPAGGYALVAGNCFRDSVGGLSPSPNLFIFENGGLRDVSSVAESRADLVAASWRPDGSSCLLAGFDQTWHTPVLMSYEDGSLTEVPWADEGVFPTACSWHPSGEYALVGTSAMTSDEGATALYRFDGRSVTKLHDLDGVGVSCISWSPSGECLLVVSRSVRAYSV